jgi:phosphopentomutase
VSPWTDLEKVLVIVCDSWGVGDAPDAADYGDEGSDTLGHVASAAGGLSAPNLQGLGLGHLDEVKGVPPQALPRTAHGRLTERSAGKDSLTGHWEIAGLILDRPFPTYPLGFPSKIVAPFERAIRRRVLGNRPASGTDIVAELGEEHLRTGRPILYTSGDSVFQLAAHVGIVPLQRLYEWCRVARRLLTGEHAVGRVIARPFDGELGAFVRRPERRDLTLQPPTDTVLDRLQSVGVQTYGVGKIRDLFAGSGLTESRHSSSDDEGIDVSLKYLARPGRAFVFANLVDFDSKYGHRNDPAGYARCIERFDRRIPELQRAVGERGALFVTGDHGCDPTTPPTDHSRERTPVLMWSPLARSPADIGTRGCFGDLGATIAEMLGADFSGLHGTSFAAELLAGRRA